MGEDPNIYVACDYYATGEGRTVYLMITRALPSKDKGDYEVEPSFDSNFVYNPGVLKTTKEERAIREMKEYAGEWFGQGAEVLTREEFFKRYDAFVHYEGVLNSFTSGSEQPFGFSFQQRIHFNFS